MNKIVEQIQESYRKERERVSYSLPDVGMYLENLAEKGLIWVLKDMGDISSIEEAGIEKYLNDYRANQVYDNLEDYFYLKPSQSKKLQNANFNLIQIIFPKTHYPDRRR